MDKRCETKLGVLSVRTHIVIYSKEHSGGEWGLGIAKSILFLLFSRGKLRISPVPKRQNTKLAKLRDFIVCEHETGRNIFSCPVP